MSSSHQDDDQSIARALGLEQFAVDEEDSASVGNFIAPKVLEAPRGVGETELDSEGRHLQRSEGAGTEPSVVQWEQHQYQHQHHPHAASYQDPRSGDAHRELHRASGGGVLRAAASTGTPMHSSAGPTQVQPQQNPRRQRQQQQQQQRQPRSQPPKAARVASAAEEDEAQQQAAQAVAQVLSGAQVPRLPAFRALMDLVNNSAPAAAAARAATGQKAERKGSHGAAGLPGGAGAE
ncbi:hypothetical protein CHLRE_06g279216v5 [Chlamydomonas reinhardtii]|uniref:Uncharacterized protein n=1 Tax=Chlamydomonas reinhardtii TaxID=3055 RepID=A0A2K3DPH7_CHLRE|nr:uncharacterized protein CHLRE_06g279216v5 [Chlamydomonas reinhardtii]PNW82444.1 hypothetical protein CHLRE_06g279216v5 [Chlamydomonas reinhardtii]